MTEPFDPRDELASAHLDGATTPEEDREIAGDPALRARVEALRAVRDAVRAAPDEIDGARRDQAIAAALSAFDAAPPGSGAGVSSLADAAARRRSRTQRLRVVGAAAAVLLLAVLVPTLARLGDDEPADRTAMTEAADAAGSADRAVSTTTVVPFGARDDVSTDAASSAEGGLTLAAPVGVHLGQFDDLALLADAAAAHIPDGSTGVPPGTTVPAAPDAAADECLRRATDDAGAAGLPVVLVATAELEGRPVVVVVVDHPDERTLTATDPATGCSVVGTATLPR